MKNNIFSLIPENIEGETFQELVKSPDCRIERIISSKENQFDRSWYDQDEDEFVILLQGSAKLEFVSQKYVELCSGDFLHIKAHERHRLLEVSKEVDSVWLAFFFNKD